MKYVMRRLMVSPLLTALVAVAYTALYAYLVLIGGEPTSSIGDVFATGLWIGALVSLVFIFYPQKKLS
jgi:hypothetical protein